jgi:3'-5' exoribonuclease 1|uniref:Exonuclease domain-containing protein n=1 Tax=Haptolina ericina TaxID=156174 RepID=A0A7S3BTH8_9EUKA|mmetsp:Transcript_67053/g.149620  ORF Transcript_67053/g.149620 Transcript_67053/m.149620 type:complete len:120 (+) Transcript_67053:224-583(+)
MLSQADGVWDLRYFLHGECTRKGISRAPYFDKWCNLKDLFADVYSVPPCKIQQMLELQGLQLEGRLHSGIDDTRNLARIAGRMRADGAVLYINEVIPPAMRSDGVLAGRTRVFSKYEEG